MLINGLQEAYTAVGENIGQISNEAQTTTAFLMWASNRRPHWFEKSVHVLASNCEFSTDNFGELEYVKFHLGDEEHQVSSVYDERFELSSVGCGDIIGNNYLSINAVILKDQKLDAYICCIQEAHYHLLEWKGMVGNSLYLLEKKGVLTQDERTAFEERYVESQGVDKCDSF